MLLDLESLLKVHSLTVKGVIHVGAHFGREYECYKKLNIDKGIFFEPTPSSFEKLKINVVDDGFQLFNKAVGNYNGDVELFVENINQGQSNSILEPTRHLDDYPDIRFEDAKQTAKIVRLDDFIEQPEKFNFLNIDVQGYELEVLKGANTLLENSIDCILSEINFDQLYKNGVNVDELDEYLDKFSFVRVETKWWKKSCWGDGFYLKIKKPKVHSSDMKCLKLARDLIDIEGTNEPVVFDVGANLGTHSEIMVKHLCPTGQSNLHLFEPNLEVYNLLLNTFVAKQANVVNNFGLSRTSGTVEFFVPERKSSLGSQFRREVFSQNNKKWGETRTCSVQMSTLDQYAFQYGIENIHYLKIDTEGAELDVLVGSKELLSSRKILSGQFEYGGTFKDARVTIGQVVKFLHQYGYVIFDVEKNNIVNESFQDDFKMKNFLFTHSENIQHIYPA